MAVSREPGSKEHIWVAVRPYTSKPEERTVILTAEFRVGRGHEKERVEALFLEAHDVLERIVSTREDEMIVLCRKFEQEDCISAGGELPPLADATPDVSELRTRRSAAAKTGITQAQVLLRSTPEPRRRLSRGRPPRMAVAGLRRSRTAR